jgi:hypothetical protein
VRKTKNYEKAHYLHNTKKELAKTHFQNIARALKIIKFNADKEQPIKEPT